MFKSKLRAYNSNLKIITNGALFNKTFEPIKGFYSIFGLMSYERNGNSFKIIPWWVATYIVLLSVASTGYLIKSVEWYWIGEWQITLRHLGLTFLYVSSILHILIIWLLNINSQEVIKLFQNFDFIETTIPNNNYFFKKSDKLNIFLHIFDVAFIALLHLDILLASWIADYLVTAFVHIAIDSSVHQFCILINMISSYGRVINNSICKMYKRPEYCPEKGDPIMYLLRYKVFRLARTNNQLCQDLIADTLNIEEIALMSHKLLENLYITNQKYNVAVSIKFYYVLEYLFNIYQVSYYYHN